MASVGYATLSIVPSIRGLAGELNRQLRGASRPARQSGEQIGDQISGGAEKGLGRLQRSMTTVSAGASKAFSGVVDTVGRLAPAVGSATRSTTQLGQGMRGVYTSASGLGGALNNVGLAANTAFTVGREGASLMAAGMARTGVSASQANSVFYRMGGTLGNIGRAGGAALSTVGSSAVGAATTMRTSLSNAATSAGDTIRNVLGGAIGQVTALIGAIGIGALGAEIARVATSAQTTEASLTALYEAAGAGASEVNDVMAQMGERFRHLDMTTMREGATSLAYMGVQGTEAVDVLERMEAATRAAGTGSEGLTRAFAAMTSGVNAGKFQMDTLNQISDAGIPIYDALADVLGVDIPTAQAMATEGAVGLQDVLEALSGDQGTWFPALLEGAEGVEQTFSGAWQAIRNGFVNGWADQVEPLFERATPLMLRLADAVEGGFSALPGIMSRIRSALVDSGVIDALSGMVTGVREFASAAAPAVGPFVEAVRVGLAVSLEIARRAIEAVGGALSGMAGWMRENQGAVALLGAVVGGMVAGLTVYATVMGIVRVATLAWAAAQMVLSAALRANPIGLIITAIGALVAGVLYAWRNFEGFRGVVTSVWQTVRTAALWIWDQGLKPAFEGISSGLSWIGGLLSSAGQWFTRLGQAAMGLWNDYIQPAFNFIWGLIKNVLTAIIVVAILPAVAIFKALGAAAMWLWSNAIQPAFQAIGALATWLWVNAVQPAFQAIGALATWLWQNAIQPAFQSAQAGIRALAAVFQWLWVTIVQPVFQFIGRAISAWWTSTKSLFQSAINFVRGPLGSVFRWFRDSVIRPVWNAISTIINNVWNNGIKPAFDKVREGVRAMRTAFNRGKEAIEKAWEGIRDSAKTPVNFLIDTVYNSGIRPLWNKVAGIVGADKLSKVDTFATGGSVYGAGTGTSDSIPALLSHGEHVWTAREVSAVGGHNAVESIRARALAGGSTYSRGGRVGFPSAPNIPSGQRILDAVAGILKPSGILGAVSDVFSGNWTGAIDRVIDPAKEITGEIGTEGLPGVPHMIVDKGGTMIKEKLTSLIEAWNSALSGGGGAAGWVGLASASERLQGAARWARTQHGLPYQWGGGGNPSWDCSGFMAGIERVIRGQSPGRMYTTHSFAGTPPSGWERNLRSPFTVGVKHGGRGGGHMAGTLMGVNVESGGRGVQVGSGAQGTNAFPHKFGFKPVSGDSVAGTTDDEDVSAYDNGGMLKPGLQLVYNGTGKPETVRTAAQEARVERLVEALERGGVGGNVINVEPPPATVSELVNGVSYALRRSRRGGVHAGRM